MKEPKPVFEIVATVVSIVLILLALANAGAGGIAATLFLLGFIYWMWSGWPESKAREKHNRSRGR